MKKTLFTALLCLPFWGFAQAPNFTLNVKVKPLPIKTYAYIHYDVKGETMFDSVEVKNGSFTFKGYLPEPASAQLLIDHTGIGLYKTIDKAIDTKIKSDVLNFYLEDGTITVIGTDSVAKATITSKTDINGRHKRFQTIDDEFQKSRDPLITEYLAATVEQQKDTAGFLKQLNAKMVGPTGKRQAQIEKYIRDNPSSWFSLESVKAMGGPDIDVTKITSFYNLLSAELRQSPTGIEIKKEIEVAKTMRIGNMAPDFKQNDTSGIAVTLSQFKGKYILLDFWASWCGPCRQENPNLVNAYNAYKNKNFTVISVSLDSRKPDWLTAIRKDGLGDWTHISDLGSYNNVIAKQYGISAIPQNLLIGPDGRIIAKNLIGKALENKLAEVLTL